MRGLRFAVRRIQIPSRKKLQKQEALLKKLKQEIQQENSYTTVIDIDIDLTGGIIERFFDFVRGTK